MDASVAAAAAAHRRVKRAMGLLRQAAATLSPELADVDVVGEHRVEGPGDVEAAAELIRLAAHRHGAVDVVLLAAVPRNDG